MSCAEICLDMEYDGDFCDLHRSEMRRARKTHRCEECTREILPGEQYEYAAGKYDSGFYSVKTCAECVAIRSALVCGTFLYGQLWEAIQEDVFPVWLYTGPWDCLAKIESDLDFAVEVRQEARRRLQNRYQEYRKGRSL